MSDQPILVSAQPQHALLRTETPVREGRGWRHVLVRTRRGAAAPVWAWPGEEKTYRTRRDALRAGRSS